MPGEGSHYPHASDFVSPSSVFYFTECAEKVMNGHKIGFGQEDE